MDTFIKIDKNINQKICGCSLNEQDNNTNIDVGKNNEKEKQLVSNS